MTEKGEPVLIENAPAEMPDWAKYLMSNPLKNAEDRRQFQLDFPDAKGEVILMSLFREAGMLGL